MHTNIYIYIWAYGRTGSWGFGARQRFLVFWEPLLVSMGTEFHMHIYVTRRPYRWTGRIWRGTAHTWNKNQRDAMQNQRNLHKTKENHSKTPIFTEIGRKPQ